MPQPHAIPEFPADDGARLVSRLAEQVSQLEGRRPRLSAERVSTGCPGLDQALPAGGLRRGTLVEWLAARAGGGAATLALAAAGQAARGGGAVVVVDRRHGFYPPAAVSWGLAPRQLIVVRPAVLAEERWAVDQILRSEGVAALLAWPERLDDREFRRLQLAAETSGVLGLLVRPARARDEPSWAELRLLVTPLATAATLEAPTRRLRIEILRARGSLADGREIEVTLTEQRGVFHAEANPLRLAAGLAAAAAGRDAREA